MKTYFSLQYRRANRMLDEFGLAPWLAYLLIPIVFLLFSKLLFFKISYARYIYPIFAIYYLIRLGNTERNDFLKNTFVRSDFNRLRIVENNLLAAPFVLYLLYEKAFWVAVVLAVISFGLSFINTTDKSTFVVPTPFSKRPFEFTSGFRKTYFIFPLLFILCFIAISVNNFNLGAFALIVVFFVAMTFYSKCEPVFFVWASARTPAAFLNEKIKTLVLYSFLLSTPILIALIYFFADNILLLLGIELIGIGFVVMSLVAKYAYYPSEISLLPAIAMGVSLFFPPLLLLSIPYFYNRAKTNLLLYK